MTRTRTIQLPATTTHAQIDAVMAELNSNEAVTAVSVDGPVLTLHYNFPRFVFSTAWQIITRHINKPGTGLFPGYKYALLAWLEDNESVHQISQTGWDRYIQDIYVGHYRHPHSTSSQFKKASPPDKAAANQLNPTDN